jgi:AraC-like DNA-binding protein
MEYRIDLFAIFIFLGIVQAIFLCFFFFSRENRKIKPSLFQGLMLLSMALCTLEILLMYTGYIQHCLWLVDFSEPIAFVIGPSFYLLVVSLIRGEVPKKYYWHFAFSVVYLLLVIPFFLQPDVVKYNSWIWSFHPELPFKDYRYDRDPRMFWVTDHHTSLVMLSLVLYAGLGLMEILKAFRVKGESFLRPTNPVLVKLRSGVVQLFTATALLFLIKAFYKSDTGDHWFAAYISIIIYLTSFRVLNQSGFFKQASLNEQVRYKNSAVSTPVQDAMLLKLQQLMEKEKPFLQPGFSLPDLADQLGTSLHSISQMINERLGKSFFEMIAEYRVEEAKRLLIQKKNIKVEEIAEQVGYNSKSSFNIAFKKITGKTPSEFRAKNDQLTN